MFSTDSYEPRGWPPAPPACRGRLSPSCGFICRSGVWHLLKHGAAHGESRQRRFRLTAVFHRPPPPSTGRLRACPSVSRALGGLGPPVSACLCWRPECGAAGSGFRGTRGGYIQAVLMEREADEQILWVQDKRPLMGHGL